MLCLDAESESEAKVIINLFTSFFDEPGSHPWVTQCGGCNLIVTDSSVHTSLESSSQGPGYAEFSAVRNTMTEGEELKCRGCRSILGFSRLAVDMNAPYYLISKKVSAS